MLLFLHPAPIKGLARQNAAPSKGSVDSVWSSQSRASFPGNSCPFRLYQPIGKELALFAQTFFRISLTRAGQHDIIIWQCFGRNRRFVFLQIAYSFCFIWGRSSPGRALEWHSRGSRFDPDRLHQFYDVRTVFCTVRIFALSGTQTKSPRSRSSPPILCYPHGVLHCADFRAFGHRKSTRIFGCLMILCFLIFQNLVAVCIRITIRPKKRER